MKAEKFQGGFSRGVESRLVGRVGFEEPFVDVLSEILPMKETSKKALVLLVACDRVWEFFEHRKGVKSGVMMTELVRGLAVDLGFDDKDSQYKTKDLTKGEVGKYYEKTKEMGIWEEIENLGVKNVYCTIWEVLSTVLCGEVSLESDILSH